MLKIGFWHGIVKIYRYAARTYHHLSSKELGDGALNAGALHFILHVVKELEHRHAHTQQEVRDSLNVDTDTYTESATQSEAEELTTLQSSWTSCCMKLSKVSHLWPNKDKSSH